MDMFTQQTDFLRSVLLADCATCIGAGLLMTLGSPVVAELTLLPAGLLVSAGLSLFPIAAFIAGVAARPALWPLGVWVVIAGNLAWVTGSLWLVLNGVTSANGLGNAFVLLQAAAVAVLAMLEAIGIRLRTIAT
jgi:hypothetical protein